MLNRVAIKYKTKEVLCFKSFGLHALIRDNAVKLIIIWNLFSSPLELCISDQDSGVAVVLAELFYRQPGDDF